LTQTFRLLRRAGSRAVALLLASLVCIGGADFRHTGWDDPACNPLPVQNAPHDHNAHRLQAGQLPSGPVDDHCALCHSLRSLRTGLTATPFGVPVSVKIAAVRPEPSAVAGRVALSTAAPRGPPLNLL
jgi:hypothetical protein